MLTQKIKRPAAARASAFIRWEKSGGGEQREIGDFLSLGRGESNQLILEDSFVSRRHARIEKQPRSGLFVLKDMGSRNGVFLNGSRVYQAALNNNDLITIGNLKFRFSFERYDQKWNLFAQSLSEKWSEQLSRIPHIAQSGCPVLLLGPSGSGKEALAQMIHKMSGRSQGPLISINCGALTESLVESELFGHTKGSYTGATGPRKGAFMSADKGTLFLDEIGDLPLSLQPKLLRAIEYSEVKPVGADIPVKTNARIISATHKDLQAETAKRKFRKDLYYRLNVARLQAPSLMDRMEDFEPLLQNFAQEGGVSFSPEAVKALKNYHWPGNIRELKNTVLRAKAMFTPGVIDKKKALMILDQTEEDFSESGPAFLNEASARHEASARYEASARHEASARYEASARHEASARYEASARRKIKGLSPKIPRAPNETAPNLPADLERIEKTAITKALRKYRGSQNLSAEALGIPHSTFSRRLKKYGIDSENFRKI